MRRSRRIDRLARLVDNGLAAHGRPAPTAPPIRTALRELQHGRHGRRRRTPAGSPPQSAEFHRAAIAPFPAIPHPYR
jgi:hypothetical protein